MRVRSILKFLDYLRFYTNGQDWNSQVEGSCRLTRSLGNAREEVDRTRTKRSENASVGTSRHNSPGTVNHVGRHGAPIEMVIFGHNVCPPRRRAGNILIVTINYPRGGKTRRLTFAPAMKPSRGEGAISLSTSPLRFPLPSITLTTGLLGQPTGFP